MVYNIEIYTDGAAVAVFVPKWGRHTWFSKELPSYPAPTSQRAEITAIIIALEEALEKFREPRSNPYLDVTIYSDSKYAVECMSNWVYKWVRNGWTNAAGNEVANRDLIEEASDLDDRLRAEGDVKYVWIPREKNQLADGYCNDILDEQ
ncbi:ribonuclease H-like domain-containing protein [Penicillium angulare]|uniref:ribonuclease H n=1 Tax=Penicillium angulare TaxID=116970 RepID=A0A9W9F618_9EURO|nr:ribonuclease H-like domain-containing protein [Penicillium angulare]